MHISIHIGFFFVLSASMPKYVQKAKLSYADTLQTPTQEEVISCRRAQKAQSALKETQPHCVLPFFGLIKKKKKGIVFCFACFMHGLY